MGLWIAAASFLVLTGIAAYVVTGRNVPAPKPAAAEPEHSTAPQPSPQPLGGEAAEIALPPVDKADELVRQLVTKISSSPSVAAWLATDGLIRSFTSGVLNVAEGKVPVGQLHVMRPTLPLQVVEQGGDVIIDARSYERYDALAAAAASFDPAGSARLYGTMKPRIEEAYRELGADEAVFDRVLERAIVLLLETPVVDGAVQVEPHGIGYAFAAPNLENLMPVQKQLLRTGPRNVRRVQASLREIATALGIPASRLPARR